MAYTDLSSTFIYKALLTYQNLDALAENDKEMYVSGNFLFSPAKARYYAINPYDLAPHDQNVNFSIHAGQYAQSVSNTVAAYCGCPIQFPDGTVVTSLKVYWYRTDAVSSGTCALERVTLTDGTITTMANADSDSSAGNHSVEDTTIASATIDNTLYSYQLDIGIDPNDSAAEVAFRAAVITFTITTPMP